MLNVPAIKDPKAEMPRAGPALPFLAIITWGAWTNTRLNWNTYAPTVDWLCMGYVYLVIAITGVAMLWYQVLNLVDLVRSTFTRAERGPEGWQ